jgi:hypothetical protein
MDDKKIRKDQAMKILTGSINTILPTYANDCLDDYNIPSSVKTDWLNKKMNRHVKHRKSK